jgi:hypothetical protein
VVMAAVHGLRITRHPFLIFLYLFFPDLLTVGLTETPKIEELIHPDPSVSNN